MALSRSDLVSAVQASTGRTDKDAVIANGLTLALEEISQIHLFRSLAVESAALAIASSEGSVALPSDVFQVNTARLINSTNSSEIELWTKREINSHWPNPSEDPEGIPRYGYIYGSSLYVIPYSDAAYSIIIDYYKLATLASGDSSIPTITHISSYLVAWASAFVLRSLEAFESAALWQKEADRALLVAISGDNKRVGIKLQAKPFRGTPVLAPPQYWNDPFVRRNP